MMMNGTIMAGCRAEICAICMAVAMIVIGCGQAAGTAEPSEAPAVSHGGDMNMQTKQDGAYADYDREPYAVRTVLREYAVLDPDTKTGVYGRYTELIVEGRAPDTFRRAVEESNRRAEASVRARADRIAAGEGSVKKAGDGSGTEGCSYVTVGYIAAVTRADRTAFSILETEFEKIPGTADADIAYQFHGMTCDTETGAEIALSDLVGEEETCAGMLREALAAGYGVEGLASTDPEDYAWTADALGVRFYFDADAVSKEKRREIRDYTARAVTVAFPYTGLAGKQAQALAAAPEAYIAMIGRETEYDLPHGDLSVLLTQRDGSHVIRIRHDGGEAEELAIEYGDDQSDYYIIRSEGGFYLFRERSGYQEGFFYDFSRPDGGFGRFAYNTAQYFDSFLREIRLALPYNPYCAHMAEVRRSFGETSYDKSSFVPHGHYTFPSDPGARYKRFLLTDGSLQIDTYNTACRLLEDLPAAEVDSQGKETGKITVPAGRTLFFESVEGEAARYDEPPKRSYSRTFLYTCRLTDGRRIRFESSTEGTVAAAGKGYLNRFTEPVTLGEAQFEEPPAAAEVFTVTIGGTDYPLIPDFSLHDHVGEEIDFGADLWWRAEGYVGRYARTEEDLQDMSAARFMQGALLDPEVPAEMEIKEDGSVTLLCDGRTFTGALPEKRYYRTDVSVTLESETQQRTFRIILREGKAHSAPVKIELYSEGEPATNAPPAVLPMTVYMTRVP